MPESSLFPTALDSTNLYEVVARLSSTLSSDITNTTTTIPITSTTNFPTQGYIVIDNETIKYISVAVGSVDATGGRGHAGTAASHTSLTSVLVAVTAAVFNKLRAGLVATQTYLGISGSTDTATLTGKLSGLTGSAKAVNNLYAETIAGVKTFSSMPVFPAGTLQSGDNLLLNPEFQVGDTANLPLYWTLLLTPTIALVADTLFPANGGNQLTITGSGAANEGIQILGAAANWLKVKPSTTYTFSIDYKVTAGDTGTVHIHSYNGATEGTAHVTKTDLGSTTAVRYTVTFTTDADATNLHIDLKATADGDVFVVSHPKLEEGSVATPYLPALTKRPVTRYGTVASHATPSIDTNLYDFFHITAQAEAITSMTTNLTGTNAIGQKLWIAITGTAARAITWGASFEASTIALPTTTVTTARLDIGFVWTGTKWRCVGVA